MGAGWRRWKEKVRESMPGTHTDLTSNARNKAMMKTATDFSMQVKTCEKAIRAAHAANAELLSTTKTVMSLPLPQTFEDTNAGAGGAAVALHQVGGANFKADALSRVANESGHKLETEVLAPLTRWQDVHLQLVARFKELENTRLELDSRRRTVADMSTKVSTMRTRLGTSGGGAKTEAKLDSTIGILSHKEAKLKVTSQNFDQQRPASGGGGFGAGQPSLDVGWRQPVPHRQPELGGSQGGYTGRRTSRHALLHIRIAARRHHQALLRGGGWGAVCGHATQEPGWRAGCRCALPSGPRGGAAAAQ